MHAIPNFTLQEVKDYMDDHDIPHVIYGAANSNQFEITNTYNKILNGLYFLLSPATELLLSIRESLVLINEVPKEICNNNIYIHTEYPQQLHYQLTASKVIKPRAAIHETAIISSKAKIGKNVNIGPYTIIEENVIIEDNVFIGGGTKIYSNTIIKKNSSIDFNCAIGTSGMSWVWGEEGQRIIQPQLGGVIIGEDCIISTDISIVRGSLSENTSVGKGTVIAHGTKIGHGCQVGKYVHFANNVSLAGNAIIGDRSFLGSGSVVSVGIKIAHSNIVGAGAVVTKNFNEKFITLAGVPAKVIKKKTTTTNQKVRLNP